MHHFFPYLVVVERPLVHWVLVEEVSVALRILGPGANVHQRLAVKLVDHGGLHARGNWRRIAPISVSKKVSKRHMGVFFKKKLTCQLMNLRTFCMGRFSAQPGALKYKIWLMYYCFFFPCFSTIPSRTSGHMRVGVILLSKKPQGNFSIFCSITNLPSGWCCNRARNYPGLLGQALRWKNIFI